MGLDEIHPWVLRKLADVVAKPLSVISERSWQPGEVPPAWNHNPHFQERKKRRSGELQASQSHLRLARSWSRSS